MTIRLYWWRGEGAEERDKQNFGDYLSPLIVEMLSSTKVEYAPPAQADLIAIGSILHRARKARRFFMPRRLHIWGAGSDRPDRRFPARHYYHAVRGAMTRGLIQGAPSGVALGDPGLLAARWWDGRRKPELRYRLGLIPHFVDRADPRVSAIAALPGVRLIDVFDPVESVLEQIQQCAFILSSSMHGLIVADSFGVPNRRLILSRGVISDYKFGDYYSAFALSEPEPIMPEEIIEKGFGHPVFTQAYVRPGLERIQQGLIDSFPYGLAS